MWTVCITSVSHVLKVNGYGERQAKVNEKRQCFKGWETLVSKFTALPLLLTHRVIAFTSLAKQSTQQPN